MNTKTKNVGIGQGNGTPLRGSPAVTVTPLISACARPTDEHSLVWGGGGYNQGSCVYFAKRCGGYVFAGVKGVVCVHGRAVLSGDWCEAHLRARHRLFIAKTEMVMRCRGVVSRQVGVKCCGMQQ